MLLGATSWSAVVRPRDFVPIPIRKPSVQPKNSAAWRFRLRPRTLNTRGCFWGQW